MTGVAVLAIAAALAQATQVDVFDASLRPAAARVAVGGAVAWAKR